jgi:hypothetical protein
MGNLLQYANKSLSIDNKLNTLLAKINYDYRNGKIRTETEYYYRIKNMLAEFYDSLTKPTFTYRPAVSTPMSDEYNAMIEESYNDMEYIIKDCEALEGLISQSFIDAELGRSMMQNEIAYLAKKIAAIGESVAKNQPVGTVVFTELFNNLEIAGNVNAKNSCHVNTTDGILTLKPTSKNRVVITALEIDENVSNGLPGNTHCVDTLNNEMHFIGQEGLRIEPSAICDGQQDSWFEYEIFEITDDTRKACNSMGFEFDEGVSWITDDGLLRLKLVGHLASANNCSWLSMTPYLSDVKGVKACFLEKCEVITSNNNVYKISDAVAFEDILIFPFPPQDVQRIELTFVQSSKYLTKVGHFYYTSADTSNMSIFQSYDYSDVFARIDGPKPSVSLLGCKYDPTTQWVTYPDANTEFADADYIKDKLFSLPESSIDRKANQEIIDAYRYMIGIQDLNLSSCTFDIYGEYVSNIFTTDDVITSITLESEEYIPGDNPEIIRYFISLNGGITWHKIYPIHRAYQGIYKYYVNNDSIENLLAFDSTKKKSKNLSVVGECRNVQIKIEMDRPDIENATYSTPIVYEYKLKLTTGGETIEY